MPVSARPRGLDRDALNAFVDERHLFDADIGALGADAWPGHLGRPGTDEVPFGDGRVGIVEHRDRAVLAGVFHFSLFDLLAPRPHIHAGGDAALEHDRFPLEAAGKLLDDALLARWVHHLVLHHLCLRAKARDLGEIASGAALEVDHKIKADNWVCWLWHVLA